MKLASLHLQPVASSARIINSARNLADDEAFRVFMASDVEHFFENEFKHGNRRPFLKFLTVIGNALASKHDRGSELARQLENRLADMALYLCRHGMPDANDLSDSRRIEHASVLLQAFGTALDNPECAHVCRMLARDFGSASYLPTAAQGGDLGWIATTLTKLWVQDQGAPKSLTPAIDRIAAWITEVATKTCLTEGGKAALAMSMGRCAGSIESAGLAFRHMINAVLDNNWSEIYAIDNVARLLFALANTTDIPTCKHDIDAAVACLLKHPPRCEALCNSPRFHYLANLFTRRHLFGTSVDALRDWCVRYLVRIPKLPDAIATDANNLGALVTACSGFVWQPLYAALASKAIKAVLDDKSVLMTSRSSSPYLSLIAASSKLPDDAAARSFHAWALDHLQRRPIALTQHTRINFFWDEPAFNLRELTRLLDAADASPQLIGTLVGCLERFRDLATQRLSVSNQLLNMLKRSLRTLESLDDHRDFSATKASIEATQQRILSGITGAQLAHARPYDMARFLNMLSGNLWRSSHSGLIAACLERCGRFLPYDYEDSTLEDVMFLCRGLCTTTLVPRLGHQRQARESLDALRPIILQRLRARLDDRDMLGRASLDNQARAIDRLQLACGIYGSWDESKPPIEADRAALRELRAGIAAWKTRLPLSAAVYETLKARRETILRAQQAAGQPASIDGLMLDQPTRAASRCDYRAHFAGLAGPLRAIANSDPGMVHIPLVDHQGRWMRDEAEQQFSVLAALTGNHVDMIRVELRHFDNEYAIEYGILPEAPPLIYTAQSFYRVGVFGGNRNKPQGPSLNQLAAGKPGGNSGSSYALPDAETQAGTDLGTFMAATFATQESAIGYGDRMLCPAGETSAGSVDFQLLDDGACLSLTDGTELRILDGWGVIARSQAEQLNGFATAERSRTRPYGRQLAGHIPAQALQHYVGDDAVVDEILGQIEPSTNLDDGSVDGGSVERELRKLHGSVRGELALVAPSSDERMHVPPQKALDTLAAAGTPAATHGSDTAGPRAAAPPIAPDAPDQHQGQGQDQDEDPVQDPDQNRRILIGASPYAGPHCLATVPARDLTSTSPLARLLGSAPVIQYSMLGLAASEAGAPMVGLKGLAFVVDDALLPAEFRGRLALSHKDVKVGGLKGLGERRGTLPLTGYFTVQQYHPPGSAWAMPPALLEQLGIDCDGDHAVATTRYPELAAHVAAHNAAGADTRGQAAALRKLDKTRTPSVDDRGEYIWSRAAHLAESRSPLLPTFVRLQAAYLSSTRQDQLAAELVPLLYDTGLPRATVQTLERLLRIPPGYQAGLQRDRVVAAFEPALDTTRLRCQVQGDRPMAWLAAQLKADLRHWSGSPACPNPVVLSQADRDGLLERFPGLAPIIRQPAPSLATLLDRTAHRPVIARWAAHAPESLLSAQDARSIPGAASTSARDLLAAALARGHMTFTNTSKTRVDAARWQQVALQIDATFARHGIPRTAPHDQKDLARRYASGPLSKPALLDALPRGGTLADRIMRHVIEDDKVPALFTRRRLAAWPAPDSSIRSPLGSALPGLPADTGTSSDAYADHFPSLPSIPPALDANANANVNAKAKANANANADADADADADANAGRLAAAWQRTQLPTAARREREAYDRDFPPALGAGATDRAGVPLELLDYQKRLAELPAPDAAQALRRDGLGLAIGSMAARLMHRAPQSAEAALTVHIAIIDKLRRSGDLSPSEAIGLLAESPNRAEPSIRQVLASHLTRPVGRQFARALEEATRGNDALKERVRKSLSIRERDHHHPQLARQPSADFYNRAKHVSGRQVEAVIKRIDRTYVSRSTSLGRLLPQRAAIVVAATARLANQRADLHAELARSAQAAIGLQQADLIPANRELGAIARRAANTLAAAAPAQPPSASPEGNADGLDGHASIGAFIEAIMPAVELQQEKDRAKLDLLKSAQAHRTDFAQRADAARRPGRAPLVDSLAAFGGGLIGGDAESGGAQSRRKRASLARDRQVRERKLEEERRQVRRSGQTAFALGGLVMAGGSGAPRASAASSPSGARSDSTPPRRSAARSAASRASTAPWSEHDMLAALDALPAPPNEEPAEGAVGDGGAGGAVGALPGHEPEPPAHRLVRNLPEPSR